ncbi:MAG: ABC transporter ATP-binding protein [Aquamicrobium sp.]|uniref:ABC transporter ATP-binding protein n=1 Tax=Aquamicrobium sp. TaxID=1872579 RepID=UPI00349EF708|nr:ABC transporter ATP-binding protein [Aquamicrobium sp.]MCO5159218.1 ABC transporter ATP-binding protein [Aquamicrobium sp.]
MTSIEINNVSKIYTSWDGSEIAALKDVSLSIEKNEFIALVGPSGCGKSTLLRLIAGLFGVSAGEILIDGLAVREPRRETGMVFQKPTLLPWKTVMENVLFPFKLMRRSDPPREKARELLALAGLEGFENRYPDELSGGMQQRAAICRALTPDPQVLLMDEPFGALDALTREEMSIELLRIWTEQPKTIVFVTHSISEAVMLADRVVVLSARPGRIEEIVPIPIPRPRSFDSEALPEFNRCVRHIRSLITSRH